MTDTGIYYINRRGLFQMLGIGQDNIPFSKQEQIVSVPLGNGYFENINLDDADMVEYKEENTILITCRNNSSKNNYVIAFNTVLKAFSRITNWKISSFLDIDGALYGGSTNSNKLFKLFDSWEDNGEKIWTDFEQEVQAGALWGLNDMEKEYFQGRLSPNTYIRIRFSIYDKNEVYVKDRLVLQWGPGTSDTDLDEYGKAIYGKSFYGGDNDLPGTTEDFTGRRSKIRNFHRLRVRFTSQSNAPHQINWFSLFIKQKADARKRQLTKITT